MGTTVERNLTHTEIQQVQVQRDAMGQLHSAQAGKFVFFAAFDGTNNDKDNLKLSGNPYPTNVANLHRQALDASQSDESLKVRYYPGVGTGGDMGGLLQSGPFPTEPVQVAANKSYRHLAEQADNFLRDNPTATHQDISLASVGFSRGTASQVLLAQMLNEKGLVTEDGRRLAPPGGIEVKGMVMFDPVHSYIKGDMRLPPNVKGDVLVVRADDEFRTEFKAADYSLDPRVKTVNLHGNHCGIGGGSHQRGTAAAALEGSTKYFQNSGVGVADVPASLRFNADEPIPLYSEAYQTARNGDKLYSEPVDGDPARSKPLLQWGVQGERGSRGTTPVHADPGRFETFPEHMRGVLKDDRLTDVQKDNHVLLQQRFDHRMLNTGMPDAEKQVVRTQIERQFHELASSGRLNQPVQQTERAMNGVFAAAARPAQLASQALGESLGAVHVQARQSLGAGLANQGLSAEQIEQVQAYAVRSAAQHQMGPGASWMGLSLDGSRVAMKDAAGAMWDFPVREAFQASADVHLQNATDLERRRGDATALAQVPPQAVPAQEMARA
ncbi:phospholipase effector Tle1 domain-containing protein [Hydrogenophaga sp. A37]|uniref:phospholipase effector Tle1 domain-containing protein n=1 Tax=Hydrogenophaga sp. A37 TaxID=1945864 RepID=UPI0009CD4FA7|nr:DUF2235 domain-containing protein [Hydrogenophaga sp. A37]OOG79381.1 hypothetical protein B0E41_24165 [Hydrogenophaga sp. A37]